MTTAHVAFSEAVKRVQAERGSRAGYARIEQRGVLCTEVDADLRAFLARVDTAFLATASADGQPYVQHRGGPRGFIRALDAHTLAFADFSGNRQYISTGNLAENDRVCLLLLDQEQRQRVKIWGRARMVPATAPLLGELGAENAEQIFVLTVSQWDANCPRHIAQKLPASDVASALRRLEARIAELERENARLKAQASISLEVKRRPREGSMK